MNKHNANRNANPDGYEQLQGRLCPCCRQQLPYEDTPKVDLQRNVIIYKGKWARLSMKEAEVADVLCRFWRKFVNKEMLINSVYGIYQVYSRNDPPSWQALHRHFADIRRATEVLGLSIINEKGIGWSLVPKDVGDNYMKFKKL
jgi:DNA-binding response OmpR family regulator